MTKTKKWSNTYKKTINCKNPKGFSQKQYCKYGRNKTKGTRRIQRSRTVGSLKRKAHKGGIIREP